MDLYNIYFIGELIEYLDDAPAMEAYVKGKNYIYETVERLSQRLEEAGIFRSTRPHIHRLLKLLEPYNEKEELKEGDEGAYKRCVNSIQTLTRTICKDTTVFPPVKDCTLDKECLKNMMDVEHSAFFEKAVWDDLPDISKNDFSDASKCLLLGAATPAAMSCIRAGEAAVRSYYKKKTGNDPSGRAWGPLTSELKQLPGSNKDIISHLDYIRKTKRNYTQHPDKIYNQREAESVFMQIISTVHELYIDTV